MGAYQGKKLLLSISDRALIKRTLFKVILQIAEGCLVSCSLRSFPLSTYEGFSAYHLQEACMSCVYAFMDARLADLEVRGGRQQSLDESPILGFPGSCLSSTE